MAFRVLGLAPVSSSTQIATWWIASNALERRGKAWPQLESIGKNRTEVTTATHTHTHTQATVHEATYTMAEQPTPQPETHSCFLLDCLETMMRCLSAPDLGAACVAKIHQAVHQGKLSTKDPKVLTLDAEGVRE